MRRVCEAVVSSSRGREMRKKGKGFLLDPVSGLAEQARPDSHTGARLNARRYTGSGVAAHENGACTVPRSSESLMIAVIPYVNLSKVQIKMI